MKWKSIQNTTYEVSDTGQVRRGDRTYAPQLGDDGYLFIGLNLAGRRIFFKIHYLVCTTFNGVKPIGADCVRHLDGDKQANWPGNLRWGTNKENAADTILHGRQVCGFDHPNVHVTKEQARAIRVQYQAHMRGRQKAANGFILGLVGEYPDLGYRCVYKAARGEYDEMG